MHTALAAFRKDTASADSDVEVEVEMHKTAIPQAFQQAFAQPVAPALPASPEWRRLERALGLLHITAPDDVTVARIARVIERELTKARLQHVDVL